MKYYEIRAGPQNKDPICITKQKERIKKWTK